MSRAYSRKTGHACDFSEKGQKRGKKGKISASLGKNVQHLIYMLLYIHIYIYIVTLFPAFAESVGSTESTPIVKLEN